MADYYLKTDNIMKNMFTDFGYIGEDSCGKCESSVFCKKSPEYSGERISISDREKTG